jgi:hypothetical protein
MIHQSTKENVILSCLITGVHDVNRNTTLEDDDFSLAKDWCDSIKKLNLRGILFHNNLSEKTCQENTSENIDFIRINFDALYKPNVFRYLVYHDFLEKHYEEIDAVFVTDVSDVVVIKNPFIEKFFEENSNKIFCGDEPKILRNEWMIAHSEHLRAKITNYVEYEAQFKNATLLNCGIIGGKIEVMKEFIEKLSLIHRRYNFDNYSEYTGDMGAFNYLIRTQFNERLAHGFPINTEFKAYQNERKDCWFRHK